MGGNAVRHAERNYEQAAQALDAHIRAHADTRTEWPCTQCRELSRQEIIALNQYAIAEREEAQANTERIEP